MGSSAGIPAVILVTEPSTSAENLEGRMVLPTFQGTADDQIEVCRDVAADLELEIIAVETAVVGGGGADELGVWPRITAMIEGGEAHCLVVSDLSVLSNPPFEIDRVVDLLGRHGGAFATPQAIVHVVRKRGRWHLQLDPRQPQ